MSNLGFAVQLMTLNFLYLETRSAIWGGLMTVRAQFNGVQGVILSGRCRDLQEQWASGFPVSLSGSFTARCMLCH